MSDHERVDDDAPVLPGPPPPVPDLDAVSASVQRRRRATAPVPEELAHPVETDAATAVLSGDDEAVTHAPPLVATATTPRAPRPVVGPWALGLAVVSLAASFVGGWMLPLGLVAIVTAIVASRRPVERRGVVVWAIVLGALSVLYSAGWLLWAASRAGLLG
ncbi:hypothetical protein DEU34_0709 [Microbacterium sp. AG1240]|uniref:hypothetical protein n=1 Tax=Microbacterium sp. AG1240 TaxID=2183992 RepID=UPI000EAE02E9|nr:hypothetical protein [Microbacterium sp. AG1240]RKT36198.1 hypothetical protein DEU34_0709 [Microbacterium sp. AG1240]